MVFTGLKSLKVVKSAREFAKIICKLQGTRPDCNAQSPTEDEVRGLRRPCSTLVKPKIAPEALREPSGGPKKSYMKANMAPGEAQKSPEKGPREAQGSLKESPSEPQKATKSTSRPKMAQDRPGEAQEAPR